MSSSTGGLLMLNENDDELSTTNKSEKELIGHVARLTDADFEAYANNALKLLVESYKNKYVKTGLKNDLKAFKLWTNSWKTPKDVNASNENQNNNELSRLRQTLSVTEMHLENSTTQQQKQSRLHKQEVATLTERLQAVEQHAIEATQEAATASAKAVAAATTPSPSIEFFERQLKKMKNKLMQATNALAKKTLDLDSALYTIENESTRIENIEQNNLNREEKRVTSIMLKTKTLIKKMKQDHGNEMSELKKQHEQLIHHHVLKETQQGKTTKLAIKQAVSIAVKAATSALREKQQQKFETLANELAKTSAFAGNLSEINDKLREKLMSNNTLETNNEDKIEHLQRIQVKLKQKNSNITKEATARKQHVVELEARILGLEQEQEQLLNQRKQETLENTTKLQNILFEETKQNRLLHNEQEITKQQRSKIRKLELNNEKYLNKIKFYETTLDTERIRYDKERRQALQKYQHLQQERLIENEKNDRRLDENERQVQKRTMNNKLQEKEHQAMQESLLNKETELRIALDRCERLTEEVSKARAAATSAFEASDHAKHGVLAHALQAKQSTIDILQEQLLQQQQEHMNLAKRSGENVRRTAKQHQTTCERMEKDFQIALKQSSIGTSKQIDNLNNRIRINDKDMKSQIYMVKKRHQDEMERTIHAHRNEMNDVSHQLKMERERNRILRNQSNVIQRDIEDAATSGMMSILSSIEISEGLSDGIGLNSLNTFNNENGNGNGNGGITTPTPIRSSHSNNSMYEKGDININIDRKEDDGYIKSSSSSRKVSFRNDSIVPSSLDRNMDQNMEMEMEMNNNRHRTPMSQINRNIGASGLDIYHSSGISAELYKTQLNQVAYRSKTEERLRVARREMASARAVEKQLEQQALEFGFPGTD